MPDAILAYDATHANLPTVPAGQAAGYTTGTGGVRWTKADWASRPGAVRICQDAGASDTTADVLDVERGAATIAETPGWIKGATSAWRAGERPGQRPPAIYISASRVVPLIDVLRSAGITSGPRLWIAHWGVTEQYARQAVLEHGHSFPTVGIQWIHYATYDVSYFADSWLTQQSSGPGPAPQPQPPGWTEQIMAELPQLRRGDKGKAVRTLQALLVARWYDLGSTGRDHDGIDGDFGPLTESAVKDAQGRAGIAVDGIAGPQTWPVLAGV